MAIDPELAKMFDLEFFRSNGWQRKQCPTCQEPFWTLDEALDKCGDSTCVEYDFLGNPLTDAPLSLAQMREEFLSYWEGLGHGRVRRNPVVARWRDDLYLNIASIANYQPHVTSGEVAPPANPLVVSQPCIRLNDLSNIGRSGRHFSAFEMMGHHAFNDATRSARDGWGEHYWTEECVSNGHAFLTDRLGLDGKRITYKESLWSGGGNAGPCFEVFAGGLEVATLVFMCLEEDENGQFEIKGETYSMMDLRIIDTGWGLERLAWAGTGTPTAYDTVFPQTLAKLRSLATVQIADDKRSKTLVEMHARVQGVLNLDIGTNLTALRDEVIVRLKDHGVETTSEELQALMEPIEAMYGLADHVRCLSFMVGDGIVPSTVKAGYLMRLVFRRAFRYMEKLGIKQTLGELLAWNMESLLEEFPEFEAAIPRAREIAELELQRFHETRDRGLRLVDRILKKTDNIGIDELVDLYDTHGLGPHTVAEAAAQKGITVEIPDTFDAIVAERHSKEKKTKAKLIVPPEVPATRRIFYEDGGQDQAKFTSMVTWSSVRLPKNSPEGAVAMVTLADTCFFHETGGQPGDRGTLKFEGQTVNVLAARKDGEHVLHFLDKTIPIDGHVEGEIDWELRMNHTRSHTATHIMNQAVRRILGSHSWQAGTQKYADCARVDMTHYQRPTRDELARIEALANAIVMQHRPVSREWWKRGAAEEKWGMQLLQGGIPKGSHVRVVRIGPAAEGTPDLPATEGPVRADEDFDVEYCGGTHTHFTSQVGPVKIWRTEKIQDGVERIEYSAGQYAVQRWQADEKLLRDASEELAVSPKELPNASKRFFAEWKEQRKLLEVVQSQLAELKAQAAAGDAETINGVRIIVDGEVPAGSLQKAATDMVSEASTVALLGAGGQNPRILFARSPDVDLNMGEILRSVAPIIDGKGGGRPDFAQGGGTMPDKLGACLEAAAGKVKEQLQ